MLVAHLERSAEETDMPSRDISPAQKVIALAVAVVAGAAAIFVTGWLYLMLGVLTHVVAMCSDAPLWWERTYACLAVLVLIGGAAVGWWTHRSYTRYQRQKMPAQE